MIGYVRKGPSEHDDVPSLAEQRACIQRFCNAYSLTLREIYEDEADNAKTRLPGIFALTSTFRLDWKLLLVTSADRIWELDEGLIAQEVLDQGKEILVLDDRALVRKLARAFKLRRRYTKKRRPQAAESSQPQVDAEGQTESRSA